jgi:serine/threonine protein kinase
MPDNWVGRTIGNRYQIESLLGQGGMSAVYKATDPNLRRLVAIKLIHTHLSDNPNFVRRFKEEAAAVGRLRHPNIVQVHDFDIDDDTYYMVMEYLVGETLQTRLRRLNSANRYIPIKDVIRVCTQMCDAIGYAHKHELIHRDIKPANIMLDLNSDAILMDFGIVKIVGGDYHTATGATIGTAKYMSPEQIRSEKVDERSDIYSLGVTLYEMISGQTPYQADSVMTLAMMVLNDPLPDIRKLRSGIPDNLISVSEKALQKDAADRFQTMEDMAAALEKSESSLSSIASVATVVDDNQIDQKKSQTAAENIILPTKEDSKETIPGRAAQPDQVQVPEASLGKTKSSTEASEIAPLTEPGPIIPQPTLSDVGIAEQPKSRRSIIIIMALILVGIIAVVALIIFQFQQPPDLEIRQFDLPTTPINSNTAQNVVSLAKWETNAYIQELVFSPKGNQIGTVHNLDNLPLYKYRFYGAIWQLNPAMLHKYLLGHSDEIYGAAFSPDGQSYATASEDSNVITWNVSDGSQERIFSTSESGYTSVHFSPDDPLITAGSWSGDIYLWDLRNGNLLRTLEIPDDSILDVKFSPDGSLLAASTEKGILYIWQVADGSLLHKLSGHNAPVFSLAFSPIGTLLASASDDDSIGLWDVIDGMLVSSLVGHSDSVYDVTFSIDGSLLASGSEDSTLRLWQTSDGEMLHMLTEHEERITTLEFSPDGTLLVSGAADGMLHFWGVSEAITAD